MWDMAGKNIWQRKTRSVLTVLGIAMAVMLYLYMSVILGSKAAAKYGKAPGASLELQGHTFRVVGVMESANELIDSAVMMDLATAQTVFVRPSVATAVLVTATSVERVEQVAQAIGSGNKQLQALTSKEVAQSVSEMLKQQRAFMAGIKGTSVAVSVIVVAIVMIMAVGERKKEIRRWVPGV